HVLGTVLAILELAKLKVVRVLQSPDDETLFISQVPGTTLEIARRLRVTSEASADTLATDAEAGPDEAVDAVEEAAAQEALDEAVARAVMEEASAAEAIAGEVDLFDSGDSNLEDAGVADAGAESARPDASDDDKDPANGDA